MNRPCGGSDNCSGSALYLQCRVSRQHRRRLSHPGAAASHLATTAPTSHLATTTAPASHLAETAALASHLTATASMKHTCFLKALNF